MDAGGAGEEQLSLLPARHRAPRASGVGVAEVDPVAGVLVDTGLPHLDRAFDYLVPADLDDQAQPGVRVKVRFSGRDLDGFVLSRGPRTDFTGRLVPLRRVVSPEPVLTEPLLSVCREVASRCGGTVGDVIRLAIPPRHAAAEKALPSTPTDDLARVDVEPFAGRWDDQIGGDALLTRLESGQSPSAAVLVAPAVAAAQRWPALLVDAAIATLRSGRGVVLVVPDARDCDLLEVEVVSRLGKHAVVRLTADQGPQARYTAWLKVLRGHVRLVIGTRAAAYAPVRDLGLFAWWDDGDDSLAEPRAPYPQVHTVALARAAREGAALLSAGLTRSTAVQQLVEEGTLKEVGASPATVRARTPLVRVAGEGLDQARDPAAGRARVTSLTMTTLREGLARGPVLVQVPRRGYIPALSCQDCRNPVRCPVCHGPVAVTERAAVPQCRWCGRLAVDHQCVHCGSARLRASVLGSARTAEELGRAFPNVPVQVSGRGEMLASVPDTPRLVIATPGAEPLTAQGYAAAVLLDAWALLDRPELDAAEDSLRRWSAAAALVRPRQEGGTVVLAGVPEHVTLPAVEALVRWDPVWFARRELAERRALALPPAVPVATVTGAHADVLGATSGAPWPEGATLLGPVPISAGVERLIVRVAAHQEEELATVLRQVRSRWAAARAGDAVQVRMNPQDPSR